MAKVFNDNQGFMALYSRLGSLAAMGYLAVVLTGCGSNGSENGFPENFDKIGDAGRIAFMMERVPADSVARFICDAALGKIEGARIDSLATATLYPYEHYRDADLASYANAYDTYSQSLPLPEKMRLYGMAAQVNPQQMGYQLGVEYINNIRSRKMSVQDISAEIAEFKKACKSDPDTYRRFVKGLKAALEMEHGNGISEEVYIRFSNLPEE